MKITNVETNENSTVTLTIAVDHDTFEPALQKSYLKNRGRINVPGFRKGKAPRKMIESMYGSGVFYEDAIDLCYPDAYEAAIAEQKLDEVGFPQTKILEVNDDGFTFEAIVSIRPEVKLGTYKGLTAPKTPEAVTESDIEAEMQPYISRATRLVSVDRAVADGDTAVIDFEGFDKGVPFDGGKGENFDLVIGSGSFVPGFEEQLIGMKIGDQKEIDITFPENYHADLAGKPVVFKVKINEVKVSEKPEIDDEFAKDVSTFETLKEFKADLEAKVKTRREEESVQKFEDAIMQQLVDNMEVTIPETMVVVQVDKLLEDYTRRLASQGISMEDYARMTGGNMDMVRQSMRPTALFQVQSQLALDAVAKAEKFKITDADVAAEVKELAELYKVSEEQVKAAVPDETLRSDLLVKRAAELVISESKDGPLPEKKEEKEAKKTTKKATKTEKKEDKADEKTEKKADAEKTDAPKKRAPRKKAEDSGEEKPKTTRKKKADPASEE
ncbi:MAG: trigger factor [Eubacteriales bacterium]